MNSTKGGFVGSNSGTIDECYSLLKMSGRKSGVAGFCGVNSGTIRQSFHSGRVRHMEHGFTPEGVAENCFYFTGRGEAKRAKKLPDCRLWKEDTEIRNADDAEELGFDRQKWTYTGDSQVLAFNEDNWYHRLEPLPPFPEGSPLAGTARARISIDSVTALEDFARRVNAGDAAARHAEVVLTEDLDLGGRSWTPIGIDKPRSFRGAFDGRGHRIGNFRVNDKKLECRGFFGVVEGDICNLTVDCNVSGGGVIGALAGQLLGGTIRCCGAVTALRPSRKATNVGGLVGISTGAIALSYAAGRAHFFPIILFPIVLGLLLVAATASAAVMVMNLPEKPVNRPIEQEDEQLPIPEADLPSLPPAAPSERHTMTFNVTTEATASLATGKVSLLYQSSNPSSDQKVVVQLELSTGVVIARTGAILPGYQITEMTLTERAKAELTPGRYSATIHMVPYRLSDESKSFIETEVPITLTVE